MPATIDDPAVLDEMQTALENIGCAKFRMRPSYCPIPAIIRANPTCAAPIAAGSGSVGAEQAERPDDSASE